MLIQHHAEKVQHPALAERKLSAAAIVHGTAVADIAGLVDCFDAFPQLFILGNRLYERLLWNRGLVICDSIGLGLGLGLGLG
jgi:hypothetical protein